MPKLSYEARGRSAIEPAPLPGLDLDALETYLRRQGVHTFAGPVTASLITGGKSNLTYLVCNGSTRLVLRRPPLGHVLESAHDMGREFRVMKALEDSEVPVPKMLHLCADASVLGAPFYLMSYVEGHVYRWRADLESVGRRRAHAIGLASIDALASLHQIDPSAVGLQDLGRPDGYLQRQVTRWGKQLESSRSRPLPGIDELYEKLLRSVPKSDAVAIVHGDFRLDNLLLSDDDKVVAVVDWEMATLGDPLTDLALVIAYDKLGRVAGGEGIADASTAAGYPSVDDAFTRYSSTTGRTLDDMGFYIGLALFKLAVILEGIHYRHTHGQTVGDGFEQAGGLVTFAIEAGLDAMKETL